MTTRKETIIIEVRSDGARVVKRNLDGIDKSAKKADRSFKKLSRSSNTLRNGLIGLGSLLTARKVLQYADAWTSVNNQLKANLPAMTNIADESERVLQIAQDTRAPLQEMTKLYSQTSAAADELGASQAQVARLTEITGKSLAIAGASSGAAAGSLLQLTQLLGGTVVQAQEFNSILDGNRPLLQAVAAGIDRFGGSVSKLRAETRLGGFTVREFVEGALRGGDQIDKRFAAAVITVSQATTQLDNAFTAFIGKINESEGGTDTLVEALSDLTNFFRDERNIESAKLLGGAIVVSMKFALEIIRDTIEGVKGLSEEIARISTGGMDVPSLTSDLQDAGDALIAVTGQGNDLVGTLKSIAESAIRGFEPAAVTALDKIGTADKRLQAVLNAGSMEQLKQLSDTSFTEIERLITAFDSLSGREDIRANEQRTNLVSLISVWQRYGSEAVDAMKNIEKAGKIPGVKPVPKVSTDLAGGGSVVDPKAAAIVAKLTSQVNSLISAVDPAQGALFKLGEAELLLDKAVAMGIKTIDEKNNILGLLRGQLMDTINPFDAFLRNMEEEIRLTGLSSKERQNQIRVMNVTDRLRKQGVELGPEENRLIEEKIRLLQTEAEKQNTLNRIREEQKAIATEMANLGSALDLGEITGGEASLDLLRSGLFDFENTQTQLDAFVEQHRQAFEQIDLMVQNKLINESTASQLRKREDSKLLEQRLSDQKTFFGTLAGLAKSENSKLAAIGKAAAITQATIDGVLGVQKALASFPPPLNFAMAAAVGVVAAENVAQIASQRRLGGDLNEGQLSRVGEGTRPEVFKSSSTGEQFFIPPERGKVTPMKGQANQSNGGGQDASSQAPAPAPDVHITSVNVVDMTMVADYLQTEEGSQAYLNFIGSNPEAIKEQLGIG